ncbi:MAG: hypothetical protein KatS3mg115_0089 [Candidatus Poribacteria bacterium]|nr:MAG: hypothetical protein KatS3mg115_0089 [Candidatus Poribacteria bacterium]
MSIRWLTEGIGVYQDGALLVGVLRDGERAVLVEFGNGEVLDTLRHAGVRQVEWVLLTHYHADTAYGLWLRRGIGLQVAGPEAERDWIANPEVYWTDPRRRWHLYDDRPQQPILPEGVSMTKGLRGGEVWQWGPFLLHAFATPGHTDGSLSYGVVNGTVRVLFCGDLIADAQGRIWDAYSLQKGRRGLTDYHGFLGARREWANSLELLRSWGPDWIVPSHGEPIERPAEAIGQALERMERCYRLYAEASALRAYFPDFFAELGPLPSALPRAETRSVPEFLLHLGTSWVLIGEDRRALVMDCGSQGVLSELERLIAQGQIRGIDELWITHYHDDHVDAVEAFQSRFPCPTRTHRVVAEVIESPTAWRLPCISPTQVRVDHRTEDGESWTWNGFRLTAYAFPGQTRYHAALLVEGRGDRLFFIGDSFTATGMDDYCTANRNPIGSGRGYHICLRLLEQLDGVWLLNCHVEVPFRFTSEQIQQMRKNLNERQEAFGAWLAWEHPDFGLDPHWLRLDPYEQRVRPGEAATLCLVWTNYAPEPRTLRARVLGVGGERTEGDSILPGGAEGRIPFRLWVPEDRDYGPVVVPVEVWYQGRLLGAIRAGILHVSPE